MPLPLDLLNHPTRHLFFTGKGGVGKTSLSTAVAMYLADSGKRVLLVSTDAASNLDEIAFDEFASLLSDEDQRYDHVVFDTAPTGHSLLLMDATGA